MTTVMRHKGFGVLPGLLVVALALPSGARASQSAPSHHFELVRTTDGPSSFRITLDVTGANGASGVEAFAGAFAIRTNEQGSIQRVNGLGGSSVGRENSPGIWINGSETSTCTEANVCVGSTVLGYQKFIMLEDDGGPDAYNRLFIVVDGDVHVDVTFESEGWVLAETELEYRYADFRSSEGVGVVTPVRSADLFLSAELDGGKLGSIAQAIPPCSSTITGLVSRGIGELRLSGGEEPSSLRCPSVLGDQPELLDDVARGATTWSAEGMVVGDNTLQEGRLFVIDLPPCRFLIPGILGEDVDNDC